jgi:hypothetical protein
MRMTRVGVVVIVSSLIAITVALAADRPTTTQSQADQLGAAMKANLPQLRVEFSLFDPDKYQFDRSLNLTVVAEGDEADAEGLMTREQAARLLDTIAKNGFFDRAKALRGARWGKQAEPYYVLAISVEEGPAVYEKLPLGKQMTDELIGTRDALGEGPAAKAIDRMIAKIDPPRRKWAEASTHPAAMTQLAPLPAGASPLHPNYTFRAIDPTWQVEKQFYKPTANGPRYVPDVAADPATCFLVVEYRVAGSNYPSKTVTYFPSGKVFEELDSYERIVPMLPPRGDSYRRAFREDGATMQFFAHYKDGGCIDGFSVNSSRNAPQAGSQNEAVERVTDGRGSLTMPTEMGERSCAWFADGGKQIARTVETKKAGRQIWLNDSWGQWSGSGNGAESLSQREGEMGWGDQWSRDADGKITYQPSHGGGGADPAELPQPELRDRYARARAEFFTHFAATTKAAGFTLRDFGVEESATPPSTHP